MKPLSAEELVKMRKACRVAAEVLDRTCRFVEEGVTTYDIDQFAKHVMAELGCESTSHNYAYGNHVYPGYICISVNEEVIHGIGTLRRTVKKGDIVSLDVVTKYDGFVGDNTRTVLVEPVADDVRRLCEATEGALYAGIAAARAGNRVCDISRAVERFIKPYGYGIVREYCGHGVGRSMHEDPQIPNYYSRGEGKTKLRPGMTLAIEPMICLGSRLIDTQPDGWTVTTRDGKPAAHYEHTVLVTDGDPEVLTVLS